jgi:hypothetical protein
MEKDEMYLVKDDDLSARVNFESLVNGLQDNISRRQPSLGVVVQSVFEFFSGHFGSLGELGL